MTEGKAEFDPNIKRFYSGSIQAVTENIYLILAGIQVTAWALEWDLDESWSLHFMWSSPWTFMEADSAKIGKSQPDVNCR